MSLDDEGLLEHRLSGTAVGCEGQRLLHNAVQCRLCTLDIQNTRLSSSRLQETGDVMADVD